MKKTDDIRIYNYVIARNPNYEYPELKQVFNVQQKDNKNISASLEGLGLYIDNYRSKTQRAFHAGYDQPGCRFVPSILHTYCRRPDAENRPGGHPCGSL